MSFFENSRNVTINGANFTSISRKKGIELLLEHVAPGAFHDSRERYDHPKCHPNTRVAVIQAIIDWIEDGQKVSFIKWLSGPAGAGKSAIAQEIAKLCHKKGYLAASFFWSRTSAGRNDEERLIASLAYQLVLAIPEIRGYVEEAVEKDPAFSTRSLEAQMQLLVIEPLRKVFGSSQLSPDFHGPKVIVLDGLDECGTPDAQRYILRVISDSVRKFPIHLVFLIASRPEQAIRDSFDNQPLLEITSRLVLDDKYHPNDDIRLFLVESFASVRTAHKLRSLLPQVWPTHEDIGELIDKSSGQFIYASTVVKFVASPRGKPHEQLKIILGIAASGKHTPFAELDALYRHIFKGVEDLPMAMEILSCLFLIKHSRYDGSFANHIQRILCYNPGDLQLILVDLHSVIHVPDIADEKDDILVDLHSVIHVPDIADEKDDLRVLHASLQDFLMNPDRARDLYIDKGQAYARLTRHYLRYIRCFYKNTSNRSKNEIRWELNRLSNINDFYSNASPTPELFADFFAFDFLSWATILIEEAKCKPGRQDTPYFKLVDLYIWLKDQETILPNHFGPAKCLSVDRCPSFGHVLGLVCKHWSQHLCAEQWNPDPATNFFTLITHPQFSYHLKGLDFHIIRIVTGCFFDEDQEYYIRNDNQIDPLRKYFLAPESPVTGATHARLSVRIFAAILNGMGLGRMEQGGGESEDEAQRDSGGKDMVCIGPDTKGLLNKSNEVDDEALWHLCAQDVSQFKQDEGVLKFSIKILPFFLSKADYRPMLDRLACTLLSYKTGDMLEPEMEFLRNAINLYLNGQGHGPVMEDQMIKFVGDLGQLEAKANYKMPEESIDTFISV